MAKIETRPVDVRGREIQVKQLNDAQFSLLFREARVLRKDSSDPERKMTAVGRIFDILESAVATEEDREYLIDLTIEGNLGIRDLLGFINAFSADEETPKPAVRRGRVRS